MRLWSLSSVRVWAFAALGLAAFAVVAVSSSLRGDEVAGACG